MIKNKRKPPDKSKWKSGQSGNPKGRPPDPPEIKLAKKKLTRNTYILILNKYTQMSLKDLKVLFKKKDLPVLDALVTSQMIKCFETGDPLKFEVLLNRMIGKCKNEMDLHVTASSFSDLVRNKNQGKKINQDKE